MTAQQQATDWDEWERIITSGEIRRMPYTPIRPAVFELEQPPAAPDGPSTVKPEPEADPWPPYYRWVVLRDDEVAASGIGLGKRHARRRQYAAEVRLLNGPAWWRRAWQRVRGKTRRAEP